MPTPKRLVIQYDGGLADQVVEFDAKPAVTFVNPTGVRTDAPVAPTPEQFSANPGAYEGTNFDILANNVSANLWYDEVGIDPTDGTPGTYPVFTNLNPPINASIFKRDFQQGLRWWMHMYKVPLNVKALGPLQKKRMGL